MAESRKKSPARKSAGCKSSGNDKLYVDQVRQLVDLMVKNELSNLEIVNGDLKVTLGRGGQVVAVPAAAAATPAAPVAAAPAPAAAPAAESAAPASNLVEITSPMVGVFYSAPSPDSDPFVKSGDKVSGDSVVCIVEAMKVMNEIKAECSGEIVEVCVGNAEPVEFGQVLFRVKP